MPELPEVETVKQELSKTIIGKKIETVIINNSKVIRGISAEEFSCKLKNTLIKKIIRRAKLIIIELYPKKFLTIHLKMTGQLIFPGDSRKSCVSFKFTDNSRLDFNDSRLFGELQISDDWRKLKFVKKLGPEIFDLSAEEFKKKVRAKKTRIKPLIMDQKFIAGVGNLYAAEALFRAKIHPGRSASTLTDRQISFLFRELTDTLKEAILYKGSSVDSYVRVSGKPGNYVKYHKVYGRKGQPCQKCKTPIKRINIDGRGTYFCPKCQR